VARQAETRAVILKSAEQRFLEVGYSRAGLGDIAATAGFSKGAIYSNFSSKEELFLAVASERSSRTTGPLFAALEAAPDLEQKLLALDEWLLAPPVDTNRWNVVEAEFLVLSIGQPELRERIAQRRRLMREQIAALIDREILVTSAELEFDAATLADAFLALFTGLTIDAAVDPERGRSHFPAIFRALLPG
jgi:AcrR family transcriptional regulator